MNLFPSPQISEQISIVEDDPPEQTHPVSMLQLELQPSLLFVFPSSQYVTIELNLLPSPHNSMQVSLLIEDPPNHVQ